LPSRSVQCLVYADHGLGKSEKVIEVALPCELQVASNRYRVRCSTEYAMTNDLPTSRPRTSRVSVQPTALAAARSNGPTKPTIV
jgi:hypothetical protein